MKRYVTVLELGTSKATLSLASVQKDRTVEIIGFDKLSFPALVEDTFWMEEDHPVMLDWLQHTLYAFEDATNQMIPQIDVGVPLSCVRLLHRHRTFEDNKTQPLTYAESSRYRRKLGAMRLPESLQSVERYWDVHRSGTNVEGYYSDICVTKSYLTHLYRFFRRNGIRLGKVFPSLPTTAYVVMNEAERKGQTLLVDMGGYTTDFLLCNREIPVYMDSVPFGGMHITNEISLAINGSFDESERWKRFASCGCDLAQQKVFCQEVSRWLPLMDRPVPRGEHWTDEARLEVSAYYLLHSAREVLYNIFERVAAQRGTTSGEFYLLIAGGALGTLCGIEKLAAEIFRISGDRVRLLVPDALGFAHPSNAASYAVVQAAAHA